MPRTITPAPPRSPATDARLRAMRAALEVARVRAEATGRYDDAEAYMEILDRACEKLDEGEWARFNVRREEGGRP